MYNKKPAKLILTNGKIFSGYALGKTGFTLGEVCFNTSRNFDVLAFSFVGIVLVYQKKFGGIYVQYLFRSTSDSMRFKLKRGIVYNAGF